MADTNQATKLYANLLQIALCLPPKSCKLGTEDYLESAVFPPPPHHHHPHISIVFTPPIVFLPDRPKSGLKGQSQAKKVKLK